MDITMDEMVIDEKMDRKYYVQLVDKIKNEENVKDFITLISTLETEALELALPSLCLVATFQISTESKNNLMNICADVLMDINSTRGGRRAVLACLKEICNGNHWNDFFVLVDALEEPQFHIIRPILPKFDSLISLVSDNQLNFKWAQIVILRAILHTNGWIRTWAIQKSIEIDPSILANNLNFISSYIIPNLNENDIFWRCLEKNKMDHFLYQFGVMMNNIVLELDTENQALFLTNFLNSIEQLTCPTALFFLSSVLTSIRQLEVFDSNDSTLFRKVVLKARHTPYKTMRIATIRNFIWFFVSSTVLTSPILADIAHLISLFASEATIEFTSDTFSKIAGILKSKNFIAQDSEDEEAFIQSNRTSQNLKELSIMFWIQFTNQHEKQELISSRLKLRLCELLSAELKNNEEITCVLMLLHNSPEGIKIEEIRQLLHQLSEFILTQCLSTKGCKSSFTLLQSIYLPIFKQHCSFTCAPTFNIILELLEETRTVEAKRHLMHFLDNIVEMMGEVIDEDKKKRYLKFYEKREGRFMKSVDEYDMKEFNNIVASYQSTKIKLFRRFLTPSDFNPSEMLRDLIDQLDIASSFLVKKQLCELIALFIPKINDITLSIDCIRACSKIVQEEKKSINSLPALECFVKVAMCARIDPVICEEIIEHFDKHLFIANQSIQTAFVLANGIGDYMHKLTYGWAPFLIKLALFGPVPKKEAKVLTFAYSRMYSEEGKLFQKDDVERLDEVVQRARFRAVNVCVHLAENNEKWAIRLFEEIAESTAEMDKSSSRSFGLSMAHRQKTRAVELLHLIAPYIQSKTHIASLFEFCISSIIDPCQQFSIKLILEWTIVLICSKYKEYYEKVKSSEFEKSMAERRIGSISSWINILVHIARQNNERVAKCIESVTPWTSAQNFPVRCTAIAGCRLMYNMLDKKLKKNYKIVKSIIEFTSEPSGNSRRVIDNLCEDFYFAKLHANDHFDLQTIFVEIAKKTGMPPEETIPIDIIKELNITNTKSINEDQEFLNAPSDVYSALSKNASSAPNMEVDDVELEDQEEVRIESTEKTDEATSFQRKIVKDEEAAKKYDDTSLIVVASLVDKPNNLGGICRTSEIFGVDVLVVSDVVFAQDTNFKALSMSSENWQKIEGVRPQNLLAYLEGLRADGYTVIAAEQTTDSVMMHDFVFPKKSVIVMGDEKEGVPVNLLRAVDQTVEIKQVGHTRSLNVHVTAALMIAKYAEQVRFKN